MLVQWKQWIKWHTISEQQEIIDKWKEKYTLIVSKMETNMNVSKVETSLEYGKQQK